MARLRIGRDNAAIGLYILLGFILGALVYGYLLYQGPLDDAEKFYASSYVIEEPESFHEIVNESYTKPVAVMFSSENCPVCKAMEPYWKQLATSDGLPVSFWILMLNNETIGIFLDNNVTGTPTFILYANGTEKARYVGAFTGSNITVAMLEWAVSGLEGQASYRLQGDTTPIEPDHTQALSVFTAILLGFLAALSPCVFPMLAAYASTLASQRATARLKEALASFAAAMAGAASIGVLFLAAGSLAAGLGEVLTVAAGVTVTAAGVMGLLGAPVHLTLPASSPRGLVGFSLVYGLLAVKCSLPLVLGALLLVASAGLSGLPPLVGFSLGIALPVGLAVALAGRWQGLGRYNSRASRYGYAIVTVSGIVLLAYTMGLVSSIIGV